MCPFWVVMKESEAQAMPALVIVFDIIVIIITVFLCRGPAVCKDTIYTTVIKLAGYASNDSV